MPKNKPLSEYSIQELEEVLAAKKEEAKNAEIEAGAKLFDSVVELARKVKTKEQFEPLEVNLATFGDSLFKMWIYGILISQGVEVNWVGANKERLSYFEHDTEVNLVKFV